MDLEEYFFWRERIQPQSEKPDSSIIYLLPYNVCCVISDVVPKMEKWTQLSADG